MQDLINKITHGDCLEVMKTIPDKSIDLVLTDPPYNIGQDGGKGWDSIINYEYFIKTLFCELKRISKRQIIFFVSQ